MILTEILRRAYRFAVILRASTLWVNCFFVCDLRFAFGCIGDLGSGREGGPHSRELFTEPKVVVMEVSAS